MTEKNSGSNGRTAVISGEALEANLKRWLENPFWAEYYNGAPTERCRRYIALQFYFSWYGDDDSVRALKEAEAELGVPELRYLVKYCGNNPKRKAFHDRIRALGGD